MFIRTTIRKYKDRQYKSISLANNYRENGKIKTRIISNITNWPDELIEEFRGLLKGKKVTNLDDFKQTQGKSCGALLVINAICNELGITKTLGNSKQAKLALFQIMGRIINQGSRLKLASEWVFDQAVEEVLGLDNFNEDTLYKNLDWLSENQEKIEDKIFKYRYPECKELTIYLYDVTSSYFEGSKNELADYGYNRDGKHGKKQIVIGLLCDEMGYPISVEVFKGNTADNKTVVNQLHKLKERFSIENVIFVGDKGMIKSKQIDQINELNWYYITSITKGQINTLLKEEIIQLGLFDNTISEVEQSGIRYILRKNPIRADEIKNNRDSRIAFIKKAIRKKNEYLAAHPRAKVDKAFEQLLKLVKKRGMDGIFEFKIKEDERTVDYLINEEKVEENSMLDGCYVIKSNAPKSLATAQTIHDRYKELSNVELAFRTLKTSMEEIRPIFLRKESRTRGHVFVCMLAYMVVKNIWEKCKNTGFTKDHIIKTLDKIQYRIYNKEKINLKLLPDEYLNHQNKILQALEIQLPKQL